ncbi:protein kinase subdomain-containing protein PKL/CAK/ChoK [Flammula alnicola]|nr:protein kinase subdomain-containing protein PKL/CAK/ChoK [Flammula alnicola]
MVPVLSPGFSSSSSSLVTPTASSVSDTFTNSVQSLADLLVSASTSRLAENNVDVIKLDARQYKKPLFGSQLLEILRKVHVHGWSAGQISPGDIDIRRVSGALTNAVFFVSCPSVPSARTFLLRVYGSSSGCLISRPRELHILHVLSSRYKIGPQVYGTDLTATDIRDPQISTWIGARMAELHSVDIEAIGVTSLTSMRFSIAVNVTSWLTSAEEVLKLPAVSDTTRQELNLASFRKEWERYLAWVLSRPRSFGTRRVFAHNDAQYGNLLRLKDGSEGVDEHRQIIVVDFEYAGPNPAAYDIANHFHEWTANYHSPTPHLLTPSRYPTFEERRNFYTSYIQHTSLLAEDPGLDDTTLSGMITELDRDVLIWGAASHAGWAIWGIVQAREDIEAAVSEPEFDYIGYAKGRMAAFRKAIRSLDL